MGLLQTIEDDFVKVEQFVAGIVTAILPIVSLVNPVLSEEAKLSINILNAIALSTSNAQSQSVLSSAVAAITSNPELATNVLSKFNLSDVVGKVNSATEAVKTTIAATEQGIVGLTAIASAYNTPLSEIGYGSSNVNISPQPQATSGAIGSGAGSDAS